MINYLCDTLYEFWQYFKPHPLVYIAGRYQFDILILVKIIPEHLPVDTGWEQLTQPMTKAQAELRIQHFKLIKLVESEN